MFIIPIYAVMFVVMYIEFTDKMCKLNEPRIGMFKV